MCGVKAAAADGRGKESKRAIITHSMFMGTSRSARRGLQGRTTYRNTKSTEAMMATKVQHWMRDAHFC